MAQDAGAGARALWEGLETSALARRTGPLAEACSPSGAAAADPPEVSPLLAARHVKGSERRLLEREEWKAPVCDETPNTDGAGSASEDRGPAHQLPIASRTYGCPAPSPLDAGAGDCACAAGGLSSRSEARSPAPEGAAGGSPLAAPSPSPRRARTPTGQLSRREAVARRASFSVDELIPSRASFTIDELTPLRSRSLRSASDDRSACRALLPPSPQAPALLPLVEAFFAVTADHPGARSSVVWPDTIAGSCLEETVVKRGFCPGPAAFARDFQGRPFVFSLLETTLDPSGNPDGVLYGCVCGEDPTAEADPGSVEPEPGAGSNHSMVSRMLKTLKPGRSQRQPQQQPQQRWRVLCIVSKLPIFKLLFGLLQHARDLLWAHPGRVSALLDRLNRAALGGRLAEEAGVLGLPWIMSRLPPGAPCRVSRSIQPRPEQVARWQASWGLQALCSRGRCAVGPGSLAQLLACLLLEQRVLLLGCAPETSALALALRALLWPFQWMHPFLSASPAGGLDIPLADSPFPVLAALSYTADLGYASLDQVPAGVVTYSMETDRVTPNWIRLPSGGHDELAGHDVLVRRLEQVRARSAQAAGDRAAWAAEATRSAVSGEVHGLAGMVERFAEHMVAKARRDSPGANLQELIDAALERGVFSRWLQSSGRTGAAGSFYDALADTQLGRLHLEEKIAEMFSTGSSCAA